MRILHAVPAALRRACGQWGPYVLLELLLPGGTLMALLLYLHQRLRAARGHGPACGAARAPAVAVLRVPLAHQGLRAVRRLAPPRRATCRVAAC
jgi:hypothetical protein